MAKNIKLLILWVQRRLSLMWRWFKMVKNKLNKKKNDKRRYSDILKSITLAIILWLFLPLPICYRIFKDPGGMETFCSWSTSGFEIIFKQSYIFLSDTLFYFIILSLSLFIYFIISFTIIKINNKIKKVKNE